MPIIGGRQVSVRGLGFQGAGAPAQVTGLTATDFGTARAYNNGRIDLAWTAPANNGASITGYFIERSTNSGSTWSTLVANTGTTAVSYSDTSLLSATRYDYRVSAINAVGTGLASTAANATATTVPQAPTIGTATRTNNTTVSITFTAGATGGSTITSYVSTSSPSVSLSVSGSSSPITATGTFSADTSYTFTIAAVNSNGTSTYSGSSNSVTPLSSTALVVADYSSPYIRAYKFANGWVSAYSNPATLPNGQYNDTAYFTADKTTVGTTGSSQVNAYPFTIASGFGSKYTNPTGGGGNYTYGEFANSNTIHAFSNNSNSPNVWPFTVGTGFGTKYANPATLMTATYFASMNSNGTAVVAGGGSSPYISSWPFTVGTGFGTKYANPATLPTATVNAVKFNPSRTVIAGPQANINNPQENLQVLAYQFSSGFGTKYSNASTNTNANRVFWNPTGAAVGVTGNGMAVFRWSNGFSTQYSNPTSPTVLSQAFGIGWNSANDTVAIGFRYDSSMSRTYGTYAYPWNDSTGFGTKYADGGGPNLNLGDVAWAS